jgi:hypothetical protein
MRAAEPCLSEANSMKRTRGGPHGTVVLWGANLTGLLGLASAGWGALMMNQFGGDAEQGPYIGGVSVLEFYSLDGYEKWAFFGYLTYVQ